jgi:hypothetical protein
LEVSQILELERSGGKFVTQELEQWIHKKTVSLSAKISKNEKWQEIALTYHDSDLTLLNVVESV